MAETGDLIIKIGGDASKFKATIADVENSLKSFKANLGTTGLNIKIEALGFQETKSNIKSVTDFAEGTLGAVKNTIKEINQQRLSISADPNALAPFNIKLNELKTSVKELEQAGILKNVPVEVKVAENSLQGLSNKLTELRKQRAVIDPDTNARAILQINQQIEKLQEKIVNLNNLGQKISTPSGLAGGFNGIKKGSSEAGRALTSLSLIAQDLPFGFIAIQNNLPAVIQTFGQLKTAAPGAGGALKALGSALVGPAGLFLAFSAVTGAVTFAIQKYGSLGNAVDALFGRLSPLHDLTMRASKSLEEYNKNLVTNGEAMAQATGSMQGQILKANTLAGVVLNLKESEDTRKKALSQLKALDKDRFDAFDIEKGKLEGLKVAVDNYTASILANAVAQKFTDRVATAADQLETQRNLYGETLKKLDELKSKGVDKEAANLRALNAEAAKFGAEPIAPSDEIRLFEDLNIQLQQQEQLLIKLGEGWNNAAVTAKGYIQAAAKLGVIDTGGGGKGGGGKVTKGIIDEGELNNGVITSNLDYLQRVALANVRLTNASVDKMLRYRDKQAEKSQIDALIPDKLSKIPAVRMSPELEELLGQKLLIDQFAEDFAYQLELVGQAFEKSKAYIDQAFFNPLSESFEKFLETGKFSFKSFADDALKQIQRIVASELTKKLISLLANVLFPGSGSVVSAGLKTISTEALGDFLSLPGSANFNGVTGGGMQMSGSVNVVLRGSDLVGSLNRTNATINRVG
jgi:hypothetical protein